MKINRESDLGMKTKLTLGIILLLLLSGVVYAEQVRVEYTFDRPDISKILVDGNFYDRVIMPNAPNYGLTNHPALPAQGAEILIPYGSEVTGIEIIPGEKILLGDDYLIEPTVRPVKLSASPDEFVYPVPDAFVYAMSQAYPEELYSKIGVNDFRGYQILTLRLNPVQYIPSKGEIYYYPNLSVVVNTSETGKTSEFYRGLSRDAEALTGKVDNINVAKSYAVAGMRTAENYDLLIITVPDFVDNFLPLKDFHDTTDFLTEIHTTDDIGSTNPDDIRDYIRDRYINDGIDYVLIGADDELVPAKDLYVISWEGDENEVSTDMAGDIYYACLDGTYNYDGDAYWGEPNDGEGGGDVDLIAEIYVGRASVSNDNEADRFVDKTIKYITSNSPYLDKILMVGEDLGWDNEAQFGGNMMDEMIDGSTAYGYTTTGIPSDQYTIDKLYDRDWAGNDWPSSEIINRIDEGRHIISHLGHGNTSWALKLSSSEISYDTENEDHCFIYSQACYSGHFDNGECWAEYATVKEDYSAFAVVMNARYGWGSGYITDGPSQRFHREYWDAVFNPLENKKQLGPANHDSKEDNLYRINESCMRWCYYQLNLFGDPTIFIKSAKKLAIEIVGEIPKTVEPDVPEILEVDVTGVSGGVPVSGSGQFHYVINDGTVQSVSMTETSPGHYQVTLPTLTCEDLLEFYVSADEETIGTFYDTDPSLPHSLFCATTFTVALQEDFEADNGWSIDGDASDGQWTRGVPVDGGYGDPATDFDGSGKCYLTDNVTGNSDVDGGVTSLISPVMDLLVGKTEIHYARWYCNDFGNSPNTDTFMVYISNDDGANWTLVERVGPVNEASGGWIEQNIIVSDYITPTAEMKIRFDASDYLDASIVEAAVDDVSVISYTCGCCRGIRGNADADSEEKLNIADITFLVAYCFGGGPIPDCTEEANASADSGEAINISDITYLVGYCFGGGPEPEACP